MWQHHCYFNKFEGTAVVAALIGEPRSAAVGVAQLVTRHDRASHTRVIL